MDHHRLQQQQQKCKYRGGLGRKTIGVPPHPAPAPARRADVDGNDQFRRRMDYSKIASDSSSSNGSCIEEKLFTGDSQQSSSRKACERPIKALIHEEMSREKETRRSSPSVIAKLMGLDALPPAQVLGKQQKDMRSYSRRTTYAEDISHRRRNSEQEFKDVFEIKDSVKVEKNRNQPPCEGAPWSKRNETDVAFIKQKFMEAKRLSTDETLQNSKEFNDALEVLDSNKDLFLQFLQEPNSLFTKKHLNDLKCFSPSPRGSRITILRSSKGTKHEMGESSSSLEAKVESSGYLHNDAVSSCRKPINGLVNHSLTENGLSLSRKLLMSRTTNKTKSSSHPTQIVVLNPSLEKAQNLARIVSPTISHENHQYDGYIRRRVFRQSGVKELHAEGRERQKLFDNEVMGHKTKGSREIAREITKQMKRSSSSSGQVPLSGSDNLCAMSGRYCTNKLQAYEWTPNIDYRSSCSSSSSCSTESTVSKEARKSLSERWRMAHRLREARLIGRGSNTLGEMLALSDRGTSRETLMSKKVSDLKLARGSLGTRFYPSGISSRDGWKGGCSKHLSRSSLSSSSTTTHGTPNLSSRQHIGVNDRCYRLKDVLNLGADGSLPGKLNQRGNSSCRSSKSRSFKFRSLNSAGEDNRLHVREIHMCKDKLRNETTSASYSETKPILTKSSLTTNSTPGNLVNCSSVESIDTEVPFNTDEGHVQQGRQDGEFSGNIHTGTNKTLEETLADNPRVDSRRNQRDRTDPESRKSPEEAEQPSPVSVLDLPYEEKYSPESFERVNAGLQGLRMQLQLLRLEKSDTFGKECETHILIEDDTEYCSSPEQKPEVLQTFRNEDERDFSYLLDILVDSGVHGAKQDGLFDACYSLEHQVHPGMFEKFEKKYGGLGGWLRSERKLFFDLINSILAEILAPSMDLHPWIKSEKRNVSVWSHERLFEEVWQMVARQRKELSAGSTEVKILDTRWLFFGDDVDTIGREIECILMDDLMDELVSDFIFG